jgi:transcriptional regulator with XRE-family HTH domain
VAGVTDVATIGRRVQMIRKRRTDMSQTDLAVAVGVSWPTISRLERGVGKTLDLDRLRDVASALDVPVEELLVEEGSA